MQRPYIPACTCPFCRHPLSFKNYRDAGQAWIAGTRWTCGNCGNDVTDALYGDTPDDRAKRAAENQMEPAAC